MSIKYVVLCSDSYNKDGPKKHFAIFTRPSKAQKYAKEMVTTFRNISVICGMNREIL